MKKIERNIIQAFSKHYPKLGDFAETHVMSPYDFECDYYIVEIKSRNKRYDPWIIERIKVDANIGIAESLKKDLSQSIADPYGQPELFDRMAATEIEQEFDKRINNYVSANPDATLEEKRAYARSITFVLQNKYEDNKILKQSEFNLQLSDTDLVDQYNTTISDMKKLADGTLDQDTIESYKSLAKVNGYQDIQSFMNDYIPILESQLSRSR